MNVPIILCYLKIGKQHRKIVELKNEPFSHENFGQLNSYVSYWKENEMQPGDNPPVGLLLCTKKGKKMVEYAKVEINSNGGECCAQVFINHRPAEEFFAEPIPEHEETKDIESLKDENEELRTQIIDFQKRYDDIWEYCKDLERKYKELEQKSRN